jgi:ATP-dependent RNA helicase DeaD
MRALATRGYDTLTAVQDAVISAESGRDLLVSAQTGSGKTVAYGLALGDTLLDGAERFGAPGQPLALVVAPTRELAMQVEREFAWLFGEAGGRIVACVGGMDPRAERRRLDAGAHIVVGTPGRLKDHIERRALDVSGLKAVVLDEADEMLDLGFRDDLEFILETTPASRRTLLFSATVPDAIVSIARRFQRDALRVEAAGEEGAHADIEHRAIRVMPRGTDAAVVNVLRQQDAAAAIVFCSTREAVRRLHLVLAKRGFSAVVLSGELSQNERNRALEEIRDGRARVCVATDVAARGIDLANVELVIHADLPHDAEVFQHRSGRTGRAGRKGVSVLLAPASRRRKAELLMSDAGITPVWSAAPSADEIRMLDRERLANDPAMSAPAGEQELARARELIEAKGAEAVAVALLRLHAARLPEPHFVEDPGEWSSAPRERRPERSGARENDRGPRESVAPRRRDEFGDAVWFRLNVGRAQNADPKWLLPMICRRGGVTRDEVGAIRIFDKESKVAIAVEAADRFADAALGQGKGEVAFTRSDAPAAQAAKEPYKPARERKPDAPRTPRADAPEGWSPKPWRDKPRQAKPESRAAEPRFGQETPAGVKPWAAKHRPAKPRPPHNDGAKRSTPHPVAKAKRAPARREGRS